MISLSPCELWLFAYFPSTAGAGLACLWQRGCELDHWDEKECWTCGHGAGVVTASWIGGPREWITSESGISKRLPSRGPHWQLAPFCLLLVTQNSELNVCYYRPNSPNINILRASLSEQHVMPEQVRLDTAADSFGDALSAGGARVCTHATIGLGYEENSVLIASRSRIIPTAPHPTSGFMNMDLSAPFVDMPQNMPASDEPPMDWEVWGEENHIELSEVRIMINSQHLQLGVMITPILPLSLAGRRLTHLQYLCVPSPNSLSNATSKDAMMSSPGKSTPRPFIYLLASSIHFDFISPPRSEVNVFVFGRRISPDASIPPSWGVTQIAHRAFDSQVVSFISSCPPSTFVAAVGVQNDIRTFMDSVALGLISTGAEAQQTRHKGKVQLGVVKMVSIRDLTDNSRWSESPITIPTTHDITSIPMNAAVSPNGMILCIQEAASLGLTNGSLCPFPRPSEVDESEAYVAMLRNCLHADTSPIDVFHRLGSTLLNVEEILSQVFIDPGADPTKTSVTWTLKVLGMIIDAYRIRGPKATSAPKEHPNSRWKLAQETCLLVSSVFAFEDHQEADDQYDLSFVWQLISVCTWLIEFLERLAKGCVWGIKEIDRSDKGTTRAFGASSLLYVAHPFMLKAILSAVIHIRRFRDQVTKSATNNSKAQVAQRLLSDLFSTSGVDIDKLQEQLPLMIQDAVKIEEPVLRNSLAACQPTEDLLKYCTTAAGNLASSPAVDKARLFLKVSDFVDGFTALSLVSPVEPERDVVTKMNIARPFACLVCARCGGKSVKDASVNDSVPLTWASCICGGDWLCKNS